ncbi:MAG: hypothetical protein AB1646_13365 [Thermodesulfobacteriota bacterium]
MSGPAVKKARIVVILFYVFVITGLALYDEKPNPELARDMTHPLPQIMEPGNAWIVFLGFRAPEGASPYPYGEEKMRKVQNAVLRGQNVNEVLRAVNDDRSELSFHGKIPSFSRQKYCGMPAYAAAHAEEITTLLSRNEELLRRYESLRTYPRYTEPLDYGTYGPMPWFAAVKHAAVARLLQLAVGVGRGEIEEALAGAREEAEFWRFIARSSTTLISRMVACAILKQDLLFVGDLAACRRLNAQELATVRNILRPFDKGEAGLGATFRGESRYMRKSVECALGLNRNSWLPVAMIYKSNASGNRICDHFQDFIGLAEMTPQEFAVKVKQRKDSNESLRGIGIPFLYNPAGEIISHHIQAFGSFLPHYIAVGHDLEGFRRLLLLRVSAGVENISKRKFFSKLVAATFTTHHISVIIPTQDCRKRAQG